MALNRRTLQNVRARKAQKSRVVAASLPAPVGGLNARDSIAAMKEDEAVELINFFPTATDVVLRYGAKYANASGGFGGPTLMAYQGLRDNYLISILGTGAAYNPISGQPYYVTPGGVSVRVNEPICEYTNFPTPAGNYLFFVNGADQPGIFDGTLWTNPTITGVNANDFVNINAHKNRLWFVEKNTLSAWYLPVQSISGAAAKLDLSSFASEGGYLVAMATWTIDAGYGVDDLAVFITSRGQVIIYRGTDPSSATTWAMVGVYKFGSPVGRRCWTKYKGDLLILCQDGLVSLASGLQSSRLDPRVAITDKISTAISEAIAAYGNNFGWQVIAFPKQDMLLINVPVAVNKESFQFVMNTLTGAWCKFTGWNARCWALWNDDLYFSAGADNGILANAVCKAWQTAQDQGVGVSAKAIQAFSYFGSPAQQKRFTVLRPTFYVSGTSLMNPMFNVNFSRVYQSTGMLTYAPTSSGAALWDTAVWDTDTWSDEFVLMQVKTAAGGMGYNGAPVIIAQTANANSFIKWVATDVLLEPGNFV